MKVIYYTLLIILLLYSYILSADWQYYILDKTPAGDINSIVLDSNNRPYILFYYIGGNALTLAHWTGCKWIYEPLSSYENYGSDSSLAIDNKENIHASFRDCETDDLMYGYRDKDTWYIYKIDNEDNAGPFNSIAIDSKGYPHIAYCREYNNDNNAELRYAFYDGTKWNIEVVDNEYQEEGYFCSLALDSNDYPHISYMDYVPNSGWNLKYARWDGTKWIKEVISAENNYSFGHFNTDIVVDSNNRPHIVYRGGYGYKYLYYLYFDGSSWNKEVVDLCVGGLSLALDSNECPCIAYLSTLYLKYAHWDGSKWILENAKRGLFGQLQISLALDSNNYPHISCDNYYSEPYSIYYIWYGEPLVGITLTSFSAKPNGSSVVLDWSVTTDEDISGFDLYRRITQPGAIHKLPLQNTHVGEIHESPSSAEEEWTKVNSSLITGTNPYSYTDRDITPETSYEYKLDAVVSDKNETLGTTECTSGNGTPGNFEIVSIYPCPASSVINVDMNIPNNSDIDIAIYDITGRKVGTIAGGLYNSGEYTLTSDVSFLANGVYIVRMTTGELSASKNFVIAR
jgi:hypothetical protein